MILGLIPLIIILVAALGAFCFSRINLPRNPGLEGIGDHESAEAFDRISR